MTKIKGGHWVWDSELGHLVSRETFKRPENDTPAIHGDIEAFVSPIDQTVVSGRKQLRQHMRDNGVTDSRDYSQDHYDKHATQRKQALNGELPEQRRERLDSIKRAIYEMEHGRK